MKKNKYWVWLSLIKDLGSRKKQKLLEIYKTPENIYKLNKKELISVKGIGEKIADNILNESIRKNIEKHVLYMEKNKIDIISIMIENIRKY